MIIWGLYFVILQLYEACLSYMSVILSFMLLNLICFVSECPGLMLDCICVFCFVNFWTSVVCVGCYILATPLQLSVNVCTSLNVWKTNTNLTVLFEELCCCGEVGNSVFAVWTPWKRRTHRWDIIRAHQDKFTPQHRASFPKQHIVQGLMFHKPDVTTCTHSQINKITSILHLLNLIHVHKACVPFTFLQIFRGYATLEMVHLYIIRDCKSLYCCHKHNLPGSLCFSRLPYTISQYLHKYTTRYNNYRSHL